MNDRPLAAPASEPGAVGEVARATGAPASSIERALCAVLFACLEEAFVVGSAAWRAHAGGTASLTAALEAGCLLLLPLALAALPVAWLVERLFGTLGHRDRAAGQMSRAAKRWRASPRWLPHSCLFLVAGVALLYVLLPASRATTPAAALAGLCVGPELAALLEVPRLPVELVRWAGPFVLAISVVLTGGAALAFEHSSDAAQLGVLTMAPYAARFVAAGRRLFDRDDDGYSAILGGGDCNDGDPTIHPNAPDVPGNGVDENCSGTDAHPYALPPKLAAETRPLPNAPRYNVVLVHVEALRPDHTSMSGYARPTTPKIDRFKESAIWFKNAYSTAPSTRFALSQIFTGDEVARVPQRRGGGVDYWLLPEANTLAERLAPRGYDTVGFTISYVMQHIHGMGQGFRAWTTPWDVDQWRQTYQRSAELTTDAAINYVATMPQDGTKPYFLFLHYGATHDPYLQHAPWVYGQAPIDLYDSALSYEDDQLGRLFDAIDARADKDRTVVVLYSDHGELFGEHGFTKHGNTLYQPDVRVVLLARLPGAAPRAIDAPATLADLFPTVLDLTGLPPEPKCQAWDLVPYMLGAPMPSRALYFYGDLWRSGVHYENRAVLAPDGRSKFIHDVVGSRSMLLDLATDPEESTNLVKAQPALADRMADELDSWDAFESAGMHWEDGHGEGDESD